MRMARPLHKCFCKPAARIAVGSKQARDGLPGFSLERMRMNPSQDVLFWSLAAVQALGMLCCFVTRLLEATRAATSFRRLFIASLFVVCGATIAAMYCGSIHWISCGATLSIMSVGATFDLTGRIESPAF
jgi:hypothetical protein